MISLCVLVFTLSVMTEYIYKDPRLYLNARLKKKGRVRLSAEQAHYVSNVLRKKEGDTFRIFNGQDGEWRGVLEKPGKKDAVLILSEKIREQPEPPPPLYLFFSPLKKKQRMDILIEKAVELGVSAFYPVLMNRTERRSLNEPRLRAQITEAAGQCERLDVPRLYPVQPFVDIMKCYRDVPLYVCLERLSYTKPIGSYSYKSGAAFMIGPEGGFDTQEVEMITAHAIPAISLGDTILRAETAALACLSHVRLT